MKYKAIFFALMLVFSTFLMACGAAKEEQEEQNQEEGQQEEEKETIVEEQEPALQIYTTIFPLQDFANKIGGDHVEVKSIIPVGADAHTYEPTARTMIELSESDLYIYNGAGIEGFSDAVAEVLKSTEVKILTASEGVDLIDYDDDHGHDHDDHGHDHDDHDHGHDHDHDDHGHEEEDEHHNHGEFDPHVWLDPIRSIQVANNIKEALIALRPEAAEDFERNFLALKEQLENLDEKFSEMVEEVNNDTIIVSHAGYGYWSDRYGIKQVGISGISPTNEPSIKQLQNVIAFAEENNIEYILFEQNIPTNISETVKSHIGAEALLLHNLEVLVEDDVRNNEDYFSLMERNIEALRTALQ